MNSDRFYLCLALALCSLAFLAIGDLTRRVQALESGHVRTERSTVTRLLDSDNVLSFDWLTADGSDRRGNHGGDGNDGGLNDSR